MEHILSLSYGKDSLACLGAIEILGLPLDRIIHAEVWATDTISADLPPMVEFKKKADAIIKDRYGIEVEHICALKTQGEGGGKQTYEGMFYHELKKGKFAGTIKGFPQTIGSWCKKLKFETNGVDIRRYVLSSTNRSVERVVQYLGIASDEQKRIESHSQKNGIFLPLAEIGWTEEMCRKWCEENDLLSPIYTTATRGGCWFCHNQSVGQLRFLRKNYPEYWQLLLKWDADSPVTFKPDGHTVHDFDERFQLEDEKLIDPDEYFRWSMLNDDLQFRLF